MNEEDLKPVIAAAELTGRIKAKMDLTERLKDVYRPLDIATEVMVWLGESDLPKPKAD